MSLGLLAFLGGIGRDGGSLLHFLLRGCALGIKFNFNFTIVVEKVVTVGRKEYQDEESQVLMQAFAQQNSPQWKLPITARK